MLERDPLKLPRTAHTSDTSVEMISDSVVAAESKGEDGTVIGTGVDTPQDPLAVVPTPTPVSGPLDSTQDLTPYAFQDPRVTYLTPPHLEGFGVHHSIAPKPIKFNVSLLVNCIMLYDVMLCYVLFYFYWPLHIIYVL